MRRLLLIVLAASLPGCLLYFNDHGSGGDDCLLLDDTTTTGGGGAGAEPAPLRNPQGLTCDSFGGGPCDPACGPCPATPETGGGALAPIPSWGSCGSSCEALDETSCAKRDDCRVVKDARCAIGGNCLTDFMGCFPTDNFVDPSVDCSRTTDGETCSRSNLCTAFHSNEPCPLATDAACPRPFALCMPEGATPGRCHDPALCDALPPPCPTGTVAGVANGCYSGVCIPLDLCEPGPQPQ